MLGSNAKTGFQQIDETLHIVGAKNPRYPKRRDRFVAGPELNPIAPVEQGHRFGNAGIGELEPGRAPGQSLFAFNRGELDRPGRRRGRSPNRQDNAMAGRDECGSGTWSGASIPADRDPALRNQDFDFFEREIDRKSGSDRPHLHGTGCDHKRMGAIFRHFKNGFAPDEADPAEPGRKSHLNLAAGTQLHP